MEKKATVISLIFVFFIVGCAVAYIIFAGITTKDYNYVQIEVNPRVEFVLDKKFKVVSLNPLNDDAKVVLSDLNLIGKDIREATTTFLDECAKTGYIDVNGVNNATNVTVVDGITQALDVHVMQSVYKYFKENEIMCAITENYEDRHMFDEKKKNKLCCPNKYKLLTTIVDSNPELKFDSLKKLSEEKLVTVVEENHKKNPYTPSAEDKETKETLESQNKEKYDKHKKAITNLSQKEFADLFDKFQKNSIKKYQEDFEKQYKIWQENHA